MLRMAMLYWICKSGFCFSWYQQKWCAPPLSPGLWIHLTWRKLVTLASSMQTTGFLAEKIHWMFFSLKIRSCDFWVYSIQYKTHLELQGGTSWLTPLILLQLSPPQWGGKLRKMMQAENKGCSQVTRYDKNYIKISWSYDIIIYEYRDNI